MRCPACGLLGVVLDALTPLIWRLGRMHEVRECSLHELQNRRIHPDNMVDERSDLPAAWRLGARLSILPANTDGTSRLLQQRIARDVSCQTTRSSF
jgi:hypothetical protein